MRGFRSPASSAAHTGLKPRPTSPCRTGPQRPSSNSLNRRTSGSTATPLRDSGNSIAPFCCRSPIMSDQFRKRWDKEGRRRRILKPDDGDEIKLVADEIRLAKSVILQMELQFKAEHPIEFAV